MEVITLEDFQDVYRQIVVETNRNTTLLRGVSDCTYELSSTLLRAFCDRCEREGTDLDHKELLIFEFEITSKFLSAANDNISESMIALSKCVLDRLILGRHYKLYTRLIDFTANPLIALFFACNSYENSGKDGAIYVLNSSESDPNYYTAYPPKYLHTCNNNKEGCKFNYNCIIKDDKITVKDTFIIKPHNKLDVRIFSQDGYVVVPSDPTVPLDKISKENQKITKYIIPKKIKKDIEEFLDNCQITLEKLYGLPEIVDYINTETIENFDENTSLLKLLDWNEKNAYISALVIVANADENVRDEEKCFVDEQANKLGVRSDRLWDEQESESGAWKDRMKKFAFLPDFIKEHIVRNAIHLGFIDNDYDQKEKKKVRQIADLIEFSVNAIQSIEKEVSLERRLRVKE